ncbi:hypothetical protein AK812_SmicGene32115 [Symbiodinium microadriaticum]|uniref:Uncharacterized protein n=1 Tax=Symbiodinium microadriaticum TaxID=2951 RepID=A0A1Q9CV30_SYMMI|nr:hypothetical protein AK812_SmicGene32115 [Symbiodinium microadriaticum]
MFRGPGRAFATAHAHDDAVLACLGALWDPELATFTCHCSGPVCLAPFGIIWVLGCAASHVPAVYCSSWADVLPKFFIGNSSTLLQPVIASREPAVALVDTLESLLLARACLTASGLAPLSWPELLAAPPSQVVDEFSFCSVLRELDPSAAVAARIFAAGPTSPELSLAPSHFRVLLLWRLRLPLPLTAAYCRRRRRQDAFGDHLAACPAQELASRQGEGFGRSGHKAREADETQQAKQQDPKVRAGDGDIIRGWKAEKQKPFLAFSVRRSLVRDCDNLLLIKASSIGCSYARESLSRYGAAAIAVARRRRKLRRGPGKRLVPVARSKRASANTRAKQALRRFGADWGKAGRVLGGSGADSGQVPVRVPGRQPLGPEAASFLRRLAFARPSANEATDEAATQIGAARTRVMRLAKRGGWAAHRPVRESIDKVRPEGLLGPTLAAVVAGHTPTTGSMGIGSRNSQLHGLRFIRTGPSNILGLGMEADGQMGSSRLLTSLAGSGTGFRACRSPESQKDPRVKLTLALARIQDMAKGRTPQVR